jgi:hypothetical protein
VARMHVPSVEHTQEYQVSTKDENKTTFPVVEVGNLCLRTVNTPTLVVYSIAGVVDMTLTKDKDNLWTATLPSFGGKNKGDHAVLVEGYEGEKPQDFKAMFDHAFLGLCRRMRKYADACDSSDAPKANATIASLTAEKTAMSADLHAARLVMGKTTEPLTDEEQKLVSDPEMLASALEKMAEIAAAA